VGLLVIGNVTASWSLNTQRDEADIVEGLNKGPLDDSDVESECEWRFHWRGLSESGCERDGECEESERDSCSASAGRSLEFGVSGLVFREAGMKQIGDSAEQQPELKLVKSSSPKLT